MVQVQLKQHQPQGRSVKSRPISILLSLVVGSTVTGLNLPAVAETVIIRNGSLSIYGGSISYPGQVYHRYPSSSRGYYYRDRDIEDSTLINPVIIDSTIRDSTLVNPVIIDSRVRGSNTIIVSPYQRTRVTGSTRSNCLVMANLRAACQ